MFKLGSEDRQRKSAVLQIVRKSVPSRRAGVATTTKLINYYTEIWGGAMHLQHYLQFCIFVCGDMLLQNCKVERNGQSSILTKC